MDKPDVFIFKDFFPNDVVFEKPHVVSCKCDVCLEADQLHDELSTAADEIFSDKISSSKSQEICKFLNSDVVQSLCCGERDDVEELMNAYKEIWDSKIDGESADCLISAHDQGCMCVICSCKTNLVDILETSSGNPNNDDFFEIIEERPFKADAKIDNSVRRGSVHDGHISKSVTNDPAPVSYLICNANKPMILTATDNLVNSFIDANKEEEIISPYKTANMEDVEEKNMTVKDVELQKIDYSQLIDICLCENGQLSQYCLKHSVEYCQHMQTKLYEEGCTCTKDSECLFCQRLKCSYCCHERSLPSKCPFIIDEETDALTVKVSSWLDGKLKEAGVSSDLIEAFSKPMQELADKVSGETVDKNDDMSRLLVDHLDRCVNKSNFKCNPILPDLIINDEMKDDILNIDQLFDVRPFPRCYRLMGVKNNNGAYSSVKEEYIERGFNTWRQPTQFVEDMFPIAAPHPDLLARLEMEEKIRKQTKFQKSSAMKKHVKVIGLSDDWRPIINVSSDVSDYKETNSDEEKQSWSERIHEEILSKSKRFSVPRKENDVWHRVQPILNGFCEEQIPEKFDKSYDFDLKELLASGKQFWERISEKFPPSSTIGYNPDFWIGLDDWRPPGTENEIRKRSMDELKRFRSELDSFRNDFERVLKDSPGVDIDCDETIRSVLSSLKPNLRSKVEQILGELPDDWIADPDAVLQLMMESRVDLKLPEAKNDIKSERTHERTVSESEATKDFLSDDDESEISASKEETFLYDDEDVTDDVKDLSSAVVSTVVKDKSGVLDVIAVDDNDKRVALKSSSLNYSHQPSPYVEKLKERMMQNCPEGLHPIQKLWYDRPLFPFWTPSVVYDFSEFESMFFEGVPEYSPEIDATKLKLWEEQLVSGLSPQDEPDRVDGAQSPDSSLTEKEPQAAQGQDIPPAEEVKVEKAEEKEAKKKPEKKKKKKLVEDDDCLIKQDDFKMAIEKLLEEEAAKKQPEKTESDGVGGTLSLEQIKMGIAGPTKSIREGAIELDSDKDFNFDSVVPSPALKYPFKLDIFQKQAIVALEAGLSVFVAAHTSAGKTVAAEYAIAMAIRSGSRVVYTSPIKALSNQKYNDFTKKFKGETKVGIMTGDVQLNKEAECLIMTTEILRSMLYNQSSILSDLEYVIFDEVHYFNDPERGNVWEEVLILLPHQCQLVMLSATVPDVMSFASWVGTLRKREVVVTTTIRRPVTLKHYIHFSTSPRSVSNVVPIMETENKFLEHNFRRAMELKGAEKMLNKKVRGQSFRAEQAKHWKLFIRDHLVKHKRLPAVVFCFSRRRCDELAADIGNIDLVGDAKKKQHIVNFFNRQIKMLQPEDRNIDQIVNMEALLKKGIGVHHSGILPILKEIVEVLFSDSQIKLLFATETFAMGVNMPAKTVVFQQLWKYDGFSRRPLKPAEYTQMAGRAGRRGTDKSGTVIITEWNTNEDHYVQEEDLRQMMTGKVDPLQSQFRLRYSMILTAMKPEGENSIKSIINKSFFNFSIIDQKSAVQELAKRGDSELRRLAEDLHRIEDPSLRDMLLNYCSIMSQFFTHHETIRAKMFEHNHFKKLLTEGHLVVITYQRFVNVMGLIVKEDNYNKTYEIVVLKSSQSLIKPLSEKYPNATPEDDRNWFRLIGLRKMDFLPLNHMYRNDFHENLELISCKASDILFIVRKPQYTMKKSIAISIMETLKSNRRLYNPEIEMVVDFMQNATANRPTLDYFQEDQVYFENANLRVDVANYIKLKRALYENLYNVSFPPYSAYPVHNYLEKCYWFEKIKKATDKVKVQAKKEELKFLFNDFESKLEFLKNNKYIKEDDDVVDTKGRIASRMTKYEVFVTEILMGNVLENLDGPETAALLSCLVEPGVSTIVNDFTNTENPLFKPIVDTSAEIAEAQMNAFNPGVKMSRNERKSAVNNLMEKKVIKNLKKQAETENINRLIIDYLDLPETLLQAVDIVKKYRNDLMKQEDILEIDPMEDSDLGKIIFYLVPIVYAWAVGRPMKEIMKVLVTNIQEGILVRWIVNLNERIKDIDVATHHFLKDSRIKEKFESALNCIKRGIMDTPSLYLNQRTTPL